MFLNTFCRMFSKFFRFLFRNHKRRRITYPFTDEEFATALQACPVSFDCPLEEDSSDDDIDPPDCPAILPKGYMSESDGANTYAFLVACKKCGEYGDHLTKDCKISCDSEYLKRRYPGIPLPEGSFFERSL